MPTSQFGPGEPAYRRLGILSRASMILKLLDDARPVFNRRGIGK
ncbi:MAG TPA: hypothetical protein VFO16_06020 [Pseudonocardiaceae bacterium]|nr:hypothetical protein [Pseudonocardiaceae bacterium]